VLGDPNYDQMLTNAVNWVTQTSGSPPLPFPPPVNPVPEPSSVAVFLAAAVGFLIIPRSRRRAVAE
jgi:hypothetical protein